MKGIKTAPRRQERGTRQEEGGPQHRTSHHRAPDRGVAPLAPHASPPSRLTPRPLSPRSRSDHCPAMKGIKTPQPPACGEDRQSVVTPDVSQHPAPACGEDRGDEATTAPQCLRADRKYVRCTFPAASERHGGQVWNPHLPVRCVGADRIADCALQWRKTYPCSNVLSILKPRTRGVWGSA